MEVNPASAIKVAAMLGLYNLLQKSALAITYFGKHISLLMPCCSIAKSYARNGSVVVREIP
jgi:hypothetical protein